VVARSDRMRTLTVGLSTLESGHLTIAELMSVATITGVPCLLVFVVLQRHLTSTISFTGSGR